MDKFVFKKEKMKLQLFLLTVLVLFYGCSSYETVQIEYYDSTVKVNFLNDNYYLSVTHVATSNNPDSLITFSFNKRNGDRVSELAAEYHVFRSEKSQIKRQKSLQLPRYKDIFCEAKKNLRAGTYSFNESNLEPGKYKFQFIITSLDNSELDKPLSIIYYRTIN